MRSIIKTRLCTSEEVDYFRYLMCEGLFFPGVQTHRRLAELAALSERPDNPLEFVPLPDNSESPHTP